MSPGAVLGRGIHFLDLLPFLVASIFPRPPRLPSPPSSFSLSSTARNGKSNRHHCARDFLRKSRPDFRPDVFGALVRILVRIFVPRRPDFHPDLYWKS